ncbi:unnamed protein product [Rotaria sp. Silwood1]|nr:unnamed protein product [Rotaria sp. Silwood1]
MLILRLIFLIVYYWSLKIMAKQELTTMVTLGRPFRLGMLYDMRSDMLIPGVTLWDPENLNKNTRKSKQSKTDFEIITEDSFQKKAHALGVEASLKLSLVGGLINVEGSAKYAEDYQKTNHVTRLTLKYSVTTEFEELTMKHLGIGKLDHPDLHDIDLATHVVTGVLYGADAFIVFDRTVSHNENKKDISGKLKVMIDKIPLFTINAEANLSLTEQEKSVANNLNCKFYGDFRLNANPSTFAEAVNLYRELPILSNKSGNAVPKRVWLYPLSLLDNKANRIVRDISSKLVDYSMLVMENLHSLEIAALDLSNSEIFTRFDHMKSHLLDFTMLLSGFQRDLKEKIALYLPKLRGNTNVGESVLFDVFKQVDSSPFNQRKLKSWLEEERQVIELLTALVENINKHNISNIMIKSSSLDGVNFDMKYDYIFCLSLRFMEENDPQLSDMHNYLYDNSNFTLSTNPQKRKVWFKDHRVIAKIRKNLQQFVEFAKANNVENGTIKFIVDGEYSVDGVKSAELILYSDGLEQEGFIIPSKPDAPYAKNVTNNSVKLGWADAANGTEKIEKYKVMYWEYSDETLVGKNENRTKETWTEVYTSSNQKEIIISNLSSETTFVFRVQSITAIGLSAISDLSKPIETLTQKEQNGAVCACPCQNNGTCSAPNTCTCTASWTGATCTTPVCTSPCQNNGTCSAPNTCACTASWTGATCTTPVCNPVCSNGGTCSSPDCCFISALPLRSPAVEIHSDAKWKQNGITVAGGNGYGNGINQLHAPNGLYIDKDQTIYIADHNNHRIVEWKYGSMSGQVVTGGNRQGNGANQLNGPNDVMIIDKERDSLIICDFGNNRVVRWPRRNGTNGETIIANIYCTGLTMDENESLYIADWKKHEVRRYRIGDTEGTVVAGGNGEGNRLDQLSNPEYVFVDRNHSVYVSDWGNHRVMKWEVGAKQGIIVAGGEGQGNSLTELNNPEGVVADQLDTVYVADSGNDRIMRWPKGAKQGSVIAGGNGQGRQSNQLFYPHGLSFDRQGNIYVVDHFNHRVQKFDIEQTTN